MKRTLIVALVVLALSVAAISAGIAAVSDAIERAGQLGAIAANAARMGDSRSALSAIAALDAHWRARSRILELFTAHDALSEVQSAIGDAGLCAEAGEDLECLRALARTAAALERIRVAEAARLANLF